MTIRILPPPDADRARAPVVKDAGGGGASAPAAKGPPGRAGAGPAPPVDGRARVKGPTAPHDARQAAAAVRANPMLVALERADAGDMAKVLAPGPVLGGDAAEVLAHLKGTKLATAEGAGGLTAVGTGDKGGGTGNPMLAGGGIGTRGRYGTGPDGPGGLSPVRARQIPHSHHPAAQRLPHP